MESLPEYCTWGALVKGGQDCREPVVAAAARAETIDSDPPRTGVVLYAVCDRHVRSAQESGDFGVGGPVGDDPESFVAWVRELYDQDVWIAKRTADVA